MENSTTILIVDDEEIGRDALEGVLFGEGYRLIFADNGAEAYAKAVECMPDLILLDVMMPVTNGFDVCRKIRAKPLVSEIPILIVTALDDRESRLKGIEAGADDFITKPFDRLEIRARIHTILRLNRYRQLIMERVRFAWVVEQTREGFVALNQDGSITYSNPAARAFLNLSDEDSGQVSFLEQVRKHYNLEPESNWARWPAVDNRLLLLLRPETSFSRPVFLRVEVLELPLGNQNKLMVRINDATAEISQQQDLWSFHQVVTHKLRTPVSQIIMSAQLAQQLAAMRGEENLTELIQAIACGAHELQDDIQEILGYLHVSNTARAGKCFPLAALAKLLRHLCDEIGIKQYTMDIQDDLNGLAVRMPYHAVEVICRELLDNARKFHPNLAPGLEIHAWRTQANDEQPFVSLSVADDGISLTPEQTENVWRPYYQGEKTFSGEVTGMGLGLSSVANLVWEVGGKCRIYNRKTGPGVVVELALPTFTE